MHLIVTITECGRNGGSVIISTLSRRKLNLREIKRDAQVKSRRCWETGLKSRSLGFNTNDTKLYSQKQVCVLLNTGLAVG